MSARHVAVSCSCAATAFWRQRLLFHNPTLLRLCLDFFFFNETKMFPRQNFFIQNTKSLGFFFPITFKSRFYNIVFGLLAMFDCFLMVFFPKVYPSPFGNLSSSGPHIIGGWILGKTLQAWASSLSPLCLSL